MMILEGSDRNRRGVGEGKGEGGEDQVVLGRGGGVGVYMMPLGGPHRGPRSTPFFM